MEELKVKVKRLQFVLYALLTLNAILLFASFRNTNNRIEKFDQIEVGRIDIVDKNGVIKMVIASNNKIRQESRDAGLNKDEFKASGILFRNEEGEECGGLIYSGKKTKNGQYADASLTFDQYNQDQNVVLIHKENVDSLESSIDDGLLIIQRPDYKKVGKEYETYDMISKMNLSEKKRDFLTSIYAKNDVISRRRLFIGTKRGFKDNRAINETGLFIKNAGGNNKIGIYVDNEDVPHFEVYGADGKKVTYKLYLEKAK